MRDAKVSDTSRRLGPLRKVAQHIGPDDRLECGHIVPAWGLVARRRRCHWCRSEWLAAHDPAFTI
jgi:hypothetical protein